MISYYLLVTVVDALTAVNEDDWQIAADIKDGNISQFLLKPIDYLGYRLCLFFSGRLAYLAVAAIPLALFIVALRKYFVLAPGLRHAWLVPGVGGDDGIAAVLPVLHAWRCWPFGCWKCRRSSSFSMRSSTSPAAILFPLDILPPGHGEGALLHAVSLPVVLSHQCLLGKVTGAALVNGLLIQLFWVGTAFCLARFAWSRGIRRYSAVGG